MEEEGDLCFEEKALPSAEPAPILPVPQQAQNGEMGIGGENSAPTQAPGNITVTQAQSMGVDELKRHLKARGLSTRGRKRDLQDRLKKALIENVPVVDNIEPEVRNNLAGEQM